MKFRRYIGIDYSGAKTPTNRLSGLQVYQSGVAHLPERVSPLSARNKNWTRLEVAQYCLQSLSTEEPVIIGIDHGFSFPIHYMQRYRIEHWDHFLSDFMRHWPAADPKTSIDELRNSSPLRTGSAKDLRLCEQWTSSAKSVFQFDVQGSVAKSTHAGLPWLLWLREMPRPSTAIHFWPFDGFEVPEGASVVTECHPSLFRRRYTKEQRNTDEHNAWSLANWLRETDQRELFDHYFNPPLNLPERRQAALEGWILGVT